MDYPYVNGMFKALEDKILDRNKLYILNKYRKEEFPHILQGLGYGEDEEVETLIENNLKNFKELLREVTPQKEETDLLFLVNDAQNIKVLIKRQKYNLTNGLIINEGSFKKEELEKMINNDDYENIKSPLKKLITKLVNASKTIDDAKILSAYIDNSLYSFALNTSKTKEMKRYLKTKIDMTNILSLFRAKNIHMDLESFKKMIIDGGIIKKEKLLELLNLPKEEISKILENYYNGKLSKILNQNGSITNTQTLLNRLVMEVMEQDKNEALSVGPIIYYYLLKMNEAQNIRLLYTLNDVDIKDLY